MERGQHTGDNGEDKLTQSDSKTKGARVKKKKKDKKEKKIEREKTKEKGQTMEREEKTEKKEKMEEEKMETTKKAQKKKKGEKDEAIRDIRVVTASDIGVTGHLDSMTITVGKPQTADKAVNTDDTNASQPPLTLNQLAIVAASQNKLPTSRVKDIVSRMGRHTMSSAKKQGRWYKGDNYVDNANYSWRNMSLFIDYQNQMYTHQGTIKASCKK